MKIKQADFNNDECLTEGLVLGNLTSNWEESLWLYLCAFTS